MMEITCPRKPEPSDFETGLAKLKAALTRNGTNPTPGRLYPH